MSSIPPADSTTANFTPDSAPTGNAPAPPNPRFTLGDIFFGADGLRAGWAIALFLLLRMVLAMFIGPLLAALNPRPTASSGLIAPRWLYASEGAGLLALLGATVFMALLERRRATDYGLAGGRWLRNFFAGLAWGLALLSLLIAALHACGLLVFDARLLFGAQALRFGAIWLAGFLLVGLSEEFFLRGYLQFTFTRGLAAFFRRFTASARTDALGFWTSAAILSLVFGVGHSFNPGESPLGIVAAALVGLVFCLSLWRTGSLWWAIGFHTAWDWAQSFLYGVADSGLMVQGHLFATHPQGRPFLSGGLTGPEGSVLLLPVLLIAVAAIQISLPRTHRGYQPIAVPEPPLN